MQRTNYFDFFSFDIFSIILLSPALLQVFYVQSFFTKNSNMSNHNILLQMKKKNISRLSFRRQIFIAHAYVCIHYLVCIALFVLSMEFHYNFFCFFRFSTSTFDINWSCFKCFSVDASHSFFSISHNSFYILIMVSPFFNTF